MAPLDKVNQMKQDGMDESQMIGKMQNENHSPREINDALAQSKVKEAVTGGMQPSMMASQGQDQQQNQQAYNQQLPQGGPHVQEVEAPNPEMNAPMPKQGAEYEQAYADPYPQQATAGYDNYSGGGGYADQGYTPSSDTISEIASQIISEKMKKANSTISSLKEVETLLTTKVEKIDQRLERIENIIDGLQTSLLRRSGEQEQNIADIKTEMQGMQEGFGKVLNPLIDIERSLEKPKRKKRKSKKK